MDKLRAIRFERIDNVPFGAPSKYRLNEEPQCVAMILDADLFERSGHILIHNKTVFMEDRGHDWMWVGNGIRYLSRLGSGSCSILVIYEIEKVALSLQQTALLCGKMNFDPVTGKRLQ